MTSIPHEDSLVRALNGGSHDAFRAIYDLHKYRVLSIIRTLIGSESAADEVFQRVFVKLWDNRANVRPEGTLGAYLNTIARREVYTYWRQAINKNLLRANLGAELDAAEVSLQPDIEDEDYRRYLFSLADGLPERCREVFDMRFARQMSHKEIADQLNISQKTVENQISKALKHLRQRLGNSSELITLLTITSLMP